MYIGRVNCLRSKKGLYPLRLKPSAVVRFRPKKAEDRIIRLAMIIFNIGMRHAKRKIPLYRIGKDYKLYRMSTWGICLLAQLTDLFGLHSGAMCLVGQFNGKVTAGKLDVLPGFNNTLYKRLCLTGAYMFDRDAKSVGEIEEEYREQVKEINAVIAQNRIAGEKIKKGDAVMVRKGKSGGKKLYKVEVK